MNNNSFDGFMNQNFMKQNNINNINENRFIYYRNNERENMNVLPSQLHYNRNLVFNNLYKNENNNKSYGNIFTGINNNIFDNNYLGSEYFGNFSTKNNQVQNQKFITYNILNSNPSYTNTPLRTIVDTQNENNNLYQNQNINISSKRKIKNKNNNCIYNNKYNSIYSINKNNIINNNKYNTNFYINNNEQDINTITKNKSINIEDLLILEEKMSEIIYSLNKNGIMHYECFEFWNYYYNCSLFGQLEKLFKQPNEQKNVKISLNHLLISIMICYDYSYEIEIFKGDYSILDEILKLAHKILMNIYEHILNKISSESKSNIWVLKLKDLINNFNNESNDNDYFIESSQMSSIEKIIYNTSAIVQNIRLLLKSFKTQNFSKLSNL